jgi:beta-glucanase (GH16 family)
LISLLRRTASIAALTALAFAVLGACGGQTPAMPDEPNAPWQLAWSDEFEGADGSAPSPARWVYDAGGGGWGNNELESYTDRPDNSFVRGGSLVIRAAREDFRGTDGIRREYTSARLKTLGTFSQTYGRFEARMRLPRGQGLWPAFWLLGDNIDAVGWPACGEIDIMENIGREPGIVHGTLHGPGYSGGQGPTALFSNPNGRPFADDFHVFAIEWEPSTIRWYVDGTLYAKRAASDLPVGTRWVYDHNFFILLNVAVGGSWPGNPDTTTTFPQEMLVDWVRVYKR